MANKKLGTAAPAAATNTTVYTVPTAKSVVANMNVCNTTATPITINIAISATAAPTTGEYIEYGVSIPANGVLERTALIMEAGENVVVYASTVGLAVRIYGIEE